MLCLALIHLEVESHDQASGVRPLVSLTAYGLQQQCSAAICCASDTFILHMLDLMDQQLC